MRKFKIRNKKLFLIVSSLIIGLLVIYLFFRFYTTVLTPTDDMYVVACNKNDNSCHKKNQPYQNYNLSIDQRVSDLLSQMTISEKIGQMAIVERNSIKDFNDIAKYGLGSIISGGGGNPDNNTPAGWVQMVRNFQDYSQKTRLSIPLLYGVDAVHGNTNVVGATIFPHFIGLGASKNIDLVRKVAFATAEEVAATGIYWAFTPNLDVAQDIRWGRTYETFGSNTEVVATLGKAYVEGMQSFQQNGFTFASAAKHYVGNGSTNWQTSINPNYSIDQGSSNISESELRRIHLEPFKLAVEAGVKTIMVGLNQWNGTKLSFNKYLLTDVLRNELDFKGFTFSDWYGVYEKEDDKYTAVVKAVNAGVDMIMLPFDYTLFTADMHKAVANGAISTRRLDEAVTRILKVKFEIGLFDHMPIETQQASKFGSVEHRDLARQAVRESLVLLKNDNAVPIAKNTRKILVAGSAADNIGKQSGGWTVSWQGVDGNWIPGTSILKGIKDLIPSNSDLKYDLNGKFPYLKELADIGIAVVGENPYSEGVGDNANPQLSQEDIQSINNLKRASKKIVVIIISGRPLNIKEYAKDWDAIIAAWLPGSEGQGVADVLFGDYNFTGTLPIDWELK